MDGGTLGVLMHACGDHRAHTVWYAALTRVRALVHGSCRVPQGCGHTHGRRVLPLHGAATGGAWPIAELWICARHPLRPQSTLIRLLRKACASLVVFILECAANPELHCDVHVWGHVHRGADYDAVRT